MDPRAGKVSLLFLSGLGWAGVDWWEVSEVPDSAGPAGETGLLLQGQDGDQHSLEPRHAQEDGEAEGGVHQEQEEPQDPRQSGHEQSPKQEKSWHGTEVLEQWLCSKLSIKLH